MHPVFAARGAAPSPTPIWFVTEESFAAVRDELPAATRAFVEGVQFAPRTGRALLLPGSGGEVLGVLFGLEPAGRPSRDPFVAGKLPALLPDGTYRFASAPPSPRLAALAFALGAYQYVRYRDMPAKHVALEVPDGVDAADLSRIVEAVWLARDLINTPANDLGPAELEEAARGLAARHGATMRSIVGDDLVAAKFPLIHAVGRAAARAPRLIDIGWGDAADPKITLVGKGVVFDTGGLDVKPAGAMLIMKKDMGGAACILALAHMVMDARLKVRLRVLIPAVENAISGAAFRPLDVYRSRKGLTVEIGNTDAEGRLVLADALALADEETPELVIDMATLTGAARVALGPEVPPFYTDDDALAAELGRHALAENDPLWRMPLWPGYETMIESKVADITNASASGFAGSIEAALFLRRFVSAAKSYLHVDVYGWTPKEKSGRPEGGECQAARAVYALLQARYG